MSNERLLQTRSTFVQILQCSSLSIMRTVSATRYNRLSFFFFDLKPLSVLPPSSSITFPVMCADPMLERKSTTPPKSDG